MLSKLAERFPEVWPDVLAAISQIHDRYGQHRYQTQGFSYRSLALCKIVKQLPSQYLAEVTHMARQIKDAADQAMALIELSKRNAPLWPKTLIITRRIKDESARSSALCGMAQHLPEKLWPEALSITQEIEAA